MVFAALLAASAVTACSLLTSYEGLEGATNADAAMPVADSSLPDVGADADVVTEDPCTNEGVPAPPDAGAPTTSLGRLTGAARKVRFIDGDASTIFGLNMDRTCGSSCVSSAASPPKDPASGIDNAAFDLFQLLKKLGFRLGDVAFNDALKAGLWGLVLRLDGYSGAPDDDDVQLELLNAADVSGDGGARLDGTDQWVIDSTSMVAGVSLFRSKVAYVRGNVLVARFERFPLTLRVSGGSSLVLVLSPELFSVTVTAKIVSSADGGLTLAEGKLVGAMPPEQFLLQIQRLGTCKTDPIFPTAVDYVCGVRDLATTLTAPVTDKCDRISSAIAFDTIPASVSPMVKVVNDTVGCDGGDPTAGCGSR